MTIAEEIRNYEANGYKVMVSPMRCRKCGDTEDTLHADVSTVGERLIKIEWHCDDPYLCNGADDVFRRLAGLKRVAEAMYPTGFNSDEFKAVEQWANDGWFDPMSPTSVDAAIAEWEYMGRRS